MSTRGKPRVLLMHPILDPGPAILAEASEVVTYPPDRPLDEVSIRQAAEGCVGIVSQLMDPIRETVLSSPGLKIVSNVAVGFDNIDLAAATANKVMVTNTPGVLDDATSDFAFTLLMATARRVVEADYFTARPHRNRPHRSRRRAPRQRLQHARPLLRPAATPTRR